MNRSTLSDAARSALPPDLAAMFAEFGQYNPRFWFRPPEWPDWADEVWSDMASLVAVWANVGPAASEDGPPVAVNIVERPEVPRELLLRPNVADQLLRAVLDNRRQAELVGLDGEDTLGSFSLLEPQVFADSLGMAASEWAAVWVFRKVNDLLVDMNDAAQRAAHFIEVPLGLGSFPFGYQRRVSCGPVMLHFDRAVVSMTAPARGRNGGMVHVSSTLFVVDPERRIGYLGVPNNAALPGQVRRVLQRKLDFMGWELRSAPVPPGLLPKALMREIDRTHPNTSEAS